MVRGDESEAANVAKGQNLLAEGSGSSSQIQIWIRHSCRGWWYGISSCITYTSSLACLHRFCCLTVTMTILLIPMIIVLYLAASFTATAYDSIGCDNSKPDYGWTSDDCDTLSCVKNFLYALTFM
jgi:hypothetical protein